MKTLIMAAILGTSAMLGGAAVAQTSAAQASYQSLPQGTYANGTPGTEFVPQAVPGYSNGYAVQWSANPGTFNTETSQPGFVEHDHGRP